MALTITAIHAFITKRLYIPVYLSKVFDPVLRTLQPRNGGMKSCWIWLEIASSEITSAEYARLPSTIAITTPAAIQTRTIPLRLMTFSLRQG
jgi:hypothetical protein